MNFLDFLKLDWCYGTSMLPTLQKFSFIIIKKTNDYKVGDIICLKTHDKKLHIHRATQFNWIDHTVSSKGDNLPQQDYEINVPDKNIKGKLIWYYPKEK